MADTLSIMAKDLADSMTASATAPAYKHDPGYGAYTMTQGDTGAITGAIGADTITISSLSNYPVTGSFSYPNVTVTGQAYPNISSPTITLGAGIGSTYGNPWVTNATATQGKLELNGDAADVVVNGKSLMSLLERMEQRLNILAPNDKMEAEWDQLRELGKQYRELEKKLQEQGDMWAKLKAMPKIDID